MDRGMFHTTKTEWAIFWVGLFLIVLLIFTAGVIVGRASVHWGTPHISWTKEGP